MTPVKKADLTIKQTQALEAIRRQALQTLPVEQIILYGSAARGAMDSESDIDLLILTRTALTRDERHQITHLVFRVNLEYDTNFSTLVIPLAAWETGIYSVLPIHRQIADEGVAV